MMLRWQGDPTALAIGVLISGGGTLLLSALFRVWAAFSVVAATAVGIGGRGSSAPARCTTRA